MIYFWDLQYDSRGWEIHPYWLVYFEISFPMKFSSKTLQNEADVHLYSLVPLFLLALDFYSVDLKQKILKSDE